MNLENKTINKYNDSITELSNIFQRVFSNSIENFSGYWHDDKDMMLTYLTFFNKILANPKEFLKIQKNTIEYLNKNKHLSQSVMESFLTKEDKEAIISPQRNDRRFNSEEWSNNPFYSYIKQNYLLINQFYRNIVDEVEIDTKKRRKLNFYTEQFLDALSPSNYFFSNPVAQKEALISNGESIMQGYNNLISDLKKGRVSQTDESAFKVGKNLAYTKGSVVYQNELIQLIQYTPLSEKVKEIPLLIVPPWINKYYILDLQDHNSFVKYAVNEGFTVFMISWKNPSPNMRHIRFDDYVQMGIINAGEVIQEITGVKKVNALGYCLGGTLLGVSAAVLNARKKSWLNSMTFIATMLDFTDVGPMGDVIDEALVRKLERGELREEGVMKGQDMERAFNLIRPKDLIWNYVENNYLLGKKPAAFDVLFWTNDNTNLPAEMYMFYLRHMVLENKLSKRNSLTICDVPINIRKLAVPAFVIGTIEDHISPCHTTFSTTELLKGDVQFVLGGSGHVMGVANPPAKKKYGYWSGGELNEGFDIWRETAKYHEGSWWTPWSKWLGENSGKEVESRKNNGSKQYPEIEAAPGSYVLEKINRD